MPGKATELTDDSLFPYLRSDDDASTRKYLSQLLEEIAKPLIQQIVRHSFKQELSNSAYHAPWQTGEDVTADVLMKVLTRLHSFKADPQGYAISNFRGLVAKTAYRTLTDLRSENNRKRTNLERKIKRLCAASDELAIWKDESGAAICGYSAQLKEMDMPYRQSRYVSRSDLFAASEKLMTDGRRRNTAEVILFVLNVVGGPVRLSDLIGVVFARQVASSQAVPIDQALLHHRHLPALTTVPQNPLASLETRRLLELMFEELRKLKPVQRKSLLLNMTDCYGYGIEWLVFAKIASEEQLAELLELSLAEFRSLLDDLPMTDKRIGELLGLDPMKVANIRKAVRDRLKRRRQEFFRGEHRMTLG